MPQDEKIHSFLKKWIIDYTKNRDLIIKKIELIEENKNKFDIYVKYKDKEQYILIIPFLKDFNFLKMFEKEKHYNLVVFNTRENFNKIIENWKNLVEFKFLSIFFANPWSSLDKKWIIYPHTHSKISDESSLRLGLKSMFEMVEIVTENKLKA